MLMLKCASYIYVPRDKGLQLYAYGVGEFRRLYN